MSDVDSASDGERMVLLRQWATSLSDIDVRMLIESGVPPRFVVGGVLDVDGLAGIGWRVLGGIAPPDPLESPNDGDLSDVDD